MGAVDSGTHVVSIHNLSSHHVTSYSVVHHRFIIYIGHFHLQWLLGMVEWYIIFLACTLVCLHNITMETSPNHVTQSVIVFFINN